MYFPLLFSKRFLGTNVPEKVSEELKKDSNKKHIFLLNHFFPESKLFKRQESVYTLKEFMLEFAYTNGFKQKTDILHRGLSSLIGK